MQMPYDNHDFYFGLVLFDPRERRKRLVLIVVIAAKIVIIITHVVFVFVVFISFSIGNYII
jgi:hypothetical protein